uniref:Unannotated protein n=1 Tax=freshwater metagenome TaxID=449393 RepID=A0A6J7NMA2_9ZZZZ
MRAARAAARILPYLSSDTRRPIEVAPSTEYEKDETELASGPIARMAAGPESGFQ